MWPASDLCQVYNIAVAEKTLIVLQNCFTFNYISGRQPMARGPTVGISATFRGPRASRFYEVFVGRMLAANKK